MAKLMVKHGETLLYPDGAKRGGPGYVVATDGPYESAALAGQFDKLEPCADYISADAAVYEHLTAAPIEGGVAAEPAKKKVAKKKAKKKTKKKASKRG